MTSQHTVVPCGYILVAITVATSVEKSLVRKISKLQEDFSFYLCLELWLRLGFGIG